MKLKCSPPLAAAAGLGTLCMALALFLAVDLTLYWQENKPVLQENARLEAAYQETIEEKKELETQLSDLTARAETAGADAGALRATRGDYLIFTEESLLSPGDYIQTRMVELLEQRQTVERELRAGLADGINEMLGRFGAQEYIPPEPVNLTREALKSGVSAIAGELGGDVAGVLGDVVNAGIDSGGEDLLNTMGAAAAASIGGKLRDGVLNAVGVSGVVSGISTAGELVTSIQDLMDMTPDYALAVTLERASGHAQQVVEVLSDPTADTDALWQAVDEFGQFYGYACAAADLRDQSGLSAIPTQQFYNQVGELEAIDQVLGLYVVLLSEEAAP